MLEIEPKNLKCTAIVACAKAAKSVESVQSADWDKETKMIEVTFYDSKTATDKIELAIAELGHITETHKAKDTVYDELPGCCQYERLEIE